MPEFYIAPEASIKYTIVGPSGARAVLNDPTDPDFCGYLDGEEAITGIDSPELRDSYTDFADTDGGMAGSSFYTRRALVLNGKVIPASATDRNEKIGKLMAATDARFADGTITWTPTGGEPVYLNFRRQLPFRAKGGFNKDWQVGLVCAEPRIQTVRRVTQYTETNGNSPNIDHRRFTWASGSGTTLATRNVYLPPGTWNIYLPIRRSNNAGTLTIAASSSTGTNTPANLTTGWTEAAQIRVTSNAETVATTITLTLNAALTAGQWVDAGDLRVESADGLAPSNGAGFATNWAAGAGYTASFQTATPPPARNMNIGSAPSPARIRAIGPFSNVAAYHDGVSFVRLIPASAYTAAQYAVIDCGLRTIRKDNTTNDYAANDATQSTWGGIRSQDVGAGNPYINGTAGCTTATRMETTWRGGAWL